MKVTYRKVVYLRSRASRERDPVKRAEFLRDADSTQRAYDAERGRAARAVTSFDESAARADLYGNPDTAAWFRKEAAEIRHLYGLDDAALPPEAPDEHAIYLATIDEAQQHLDAGPRADNAWRPSHLLKIGLCIQESLGRAAHGYRWVDAMLDRARQLYRDGFYPDPFTKEPRMRASSAIESDFRKPSGANGPHPESNGIRASQQSRST